MERIYDEKIVSQFSPWLVEKLVKNDPLINQAADAGYEFKGLVKFKFSLN